MLLQQAGKTPKRRILHTRKESVMFQAKSGSKKPTLRERMARYLMAATFAEANEHNSALEMLTPQSEKRPHNRPERRNESREDRRPVLMA
jgi:hypothetical protein